ncbi:MAG: phosphate/phosphite/phosphonate ABC transporter substrate-binding protein [Pyrobaculum sp.]|jgi:phosphonate transport system substrate-binding protein
MQKLDTSRVYLAAVIAVAAVAAAVLIYLTASPPQTQPPTTPSAPDVRPAGERPKRLVVVVNPIPRDRVAAEAKELEEFLEKRLGVDVEIYFPLNVAAIVEALRFGHAHVALGIGALPAALALSVADVEMLLVEVREVIIDDKMVEAPYYYSYWIVRKDSPYQRLEDLRGRRACFPSELSTSGYIFPMYRLVQLGILKPPVDPKQFFGEVVFGGGYAQCWEALKNGHVDVTIMAGDVAARLYWEAMNGSRSLERQGPIPSHVVLVSKRLPPEFREELKKALLELNQRQDLMRKFVSAIFVRFEERSAEEHLRPLQEALEMTGLAGRYLR